MLPGFQSGWKNLGIDYFKWSIRLGSFIIPFIMLFQSSLEIIGQPNIGVISRDASNGVGDKHVL